jgi:hypothetical protein
MLRFVFRLFALAVFALSAIIAANFIKWHGRTVSDQLKTQLSHSDVALVKKVGALVAPNNRANHGEKIDSSERQKLKALIQELNSSRRHD